MKLAYSPASPYVRKCWMVAILRGIDSRIELWKVPTSAPELAAQNPLSKIPTLITDDGQVLYDSPVIAEYLDSVGDAPRLIPAEGPARWKALTLAALGDGILDATQPRRREIALPQDDGRKDYIATQQAKVTRALAVLEEESLGDLTTIGEIAVACALGYLDFRYPHEPWRPGHPKLEAWYARIVTLPAMARSMPPAA
ncbi:glutathione S-transferase N-terminal domain-containing protein [Roseomonas sp. HJA6]|uniref:Glutathione S-transferase N-terminal domain-containing protein n=1 Tax=Roseomonas alba TaxID=2846776 RepID=A0ABS7A8F6_9PROT|nr:glutathione S-transferase N-terminal domain-containing protein [Neoroseomonas alba]MBW6398385.1 glutathione S-transferase N-terminal domain-containing protein [Neoroseomonas alba]